MLPDKLQSGLVSIIVPCYNVERFIERFFNSLAEQTYKNLEVILVNDGATDQTGDLIQKALPQLRAEGYDVQVINQDNLGLAGAINTGLKHFTGEFLTWPDPDDWLTTDSIEQRVKHLNAHPEVGLLRSNAALYIDSEGEFEGAALPSDTKPHLSDKLFKELLFLRTFFHPICHMARSEFFLNSVGRSIFHQPRSSQNLQMLLPLVESYPVLITGEIFGNYTIRSDSRSRRAKSSQDLIDRMRMLKENTLQTIPKLKHDQNELRSLTHEFYCRNRLAPIAFEGGHPDLVYQYLSETKVPRPIQYLARLLAIFRHKFVPMNQDVAEAIQSPNFLARLFRKLTYFNPNHVKI
ncbi:MAG: glycosyltransferase family 2 protein [Verrucomicrobiales bacterium]|nr:glycosyltransferase family 2 protein [Verrucomicrobiales bacterium]